MRRGESEETNPIATSFFYWSIGWTGFYSDRFGCIAIYWFLFGFDSVFLDPIGYCWALLRFIWCNEGFFKVKSLAFYKVLFGLRGSWSSPSNYPFTGSCWVLLRQTRFNSVLLFFFTVLCCHREEMSVKGVTELKRTPTGTIPLHAFPGSCG